jgi:hypothetical protein
MYTNMYKFMHIYIYMEKDMNMNYGDMNYLNMNYGDMNYMNMIYMNINSTNTMNKERADTDMNMYTDRDMVTYIGREHTVDRVCSIFLRVDRSTNEIHESRDFFQSMYFTESRYLFIAYFFMLTAASL